MNLPVLDTTYEWNRATCVLWWLVYFTWHNVFKVHPRYNIDQNSVPFYGWVIVHSMYVPRFIDSFICRWVFGLFPPFLLHSSIIPPEDNAAMSIGVQVSVWVLIYNLGTYLEVGFIEHMLILCLAFWGTAQLFPIEPAPLSIPTSNVRGSQLEISLCATRSNFETKTKQENICFHLWVKGHT